MNNQPQPANLEAEEAILGSILFDPMAISRVEGNLITEAFYFSTHQTIYRAALMLHVQGQTVDFMSVSNCLSNHKLLDKVGGITRLSQLLHKTVSATNIDRYTELVMEKYLRRRLIASSNEIAELGYDFTANLEDVLNDSQQKLFQIGERKMNHETHNTADISIECFKELESNNPIYETGLYDVDDLMVGFEPGTRGVSSNCTETYAKAESLAL